MIPLENKIAYHDGKECAGCGMEPEVIAYYHRNGTVCGHHCTCGAMVVDNVVIGNDPR